MQECIASWAHLFADFSWRGCLMMFVAGFNDKYQQTHRHLGERRATRVGRVPLRQTFGCGAVATLSTPRGLGLVLSLPPSH